LRRSPLEFGFAKTLWDGKLLAATFPLSISAATVPVKIITRFSSFSIRVDKALESLCLCAILRVGWSKLGARCVRQLLCQ
jgi:hypothetical protein